MQWCPALDRQPGDRFSSHAIPPGNLAQTFRHSGWRPLRNRVYRALQRTDQPPSRRAAFYDCGSHSYVLKSDDTPPRYRIAGSACHDRFCVPCANERARRIAANVIEHIGSTRTRLVTLTVREGADGLAPALDHLLNSFRALRKLPWWSTRVTGGVGFVELKWNEYPGRWHPHLHLLVHGKYLPHKELSAHWHRVTGGSFIVHVTTAGGADAIARYAAKYASKPLNPSFSHDDDRLDEAIVALKGRRLCTTFGGWRHVLLVEPLSEDGWTHLGTLDSLIHSAACGDETARAVLNAIDATATAAAVADAPPRAPPTVPVIPTCPEYQGTLFAPEPALSQFE